MPDEAGLATARAPRALRWAYAATALLLLVPVWAVERVPTIDGGCHLYNAFVLRHLHDPAYPLFARTFRLSLEPVPNWLIQALLLPLVSVLSLPLAEKVLLTLYVALFAVAAWALAGCDDEARAPWAFLALPFAWSLLTHYGFYNFVVSVPLALLAVALWWRWRDGLLDARAPIPRLRWRRVLALEAVLVVTYFAHLVSLAMALGAIGVLWLLDLGQARWSGTALRRWLLHPLLLLPQLVLPAWYLRTHASTPLPNDWSMADRLRYLGELQALFAFRKFERLGAMRLEGSNVPGTVLALSLLALAIATLVRERPRTPRRHAFLVLAAICVLVYLAAPGGVGLGVVMQPRLSLFPALFLLAGLSPRIGRRTQATAGALAVLFVGWEMLELTRWHRDVARQVDAYLAGMAPLPENVRVLPLVWDRFRSLDDSTLGHASGYVLAPKGDLDWDDYQANTDLFPVRFQPGLRPPDNIEVGIDDYRVGDHAPIVDYLYAWDLSPQSPVRARLRRFYRPVSPVGSGRIWMRRADVPVSLR